MKPITIESSIAAAIKHEKQSDSLLQHLQPRLVKLPPVITLPKKHPERALRDFIVEYINHVPHFITAVSIASNEAGISDYVEPFLDVARSNFQDTSEGNEGLVQLLNKAYLAHRLIEEINDQYIVRAGIPLIPMDITKANVIIHHLLDPSLAISIDALVDETSQTMQQMDVVYATEKFLNYVKTRKGRGWDQVWNQWVEMTKALNIDLAFPAKTQDKP